MKKILVITPRFPWPMTGACQQDRAQGILNFKRLGHDVRVIAKRITNDTTEAEKVSAETGIPITTIPYRNPSKKEKIQDWIGRIANPVFLDGAAFEYHKDKKLHALIEQELDSWKPDVVWIEYTYLWPLYPLIKKRNIPIITRSINDESRHYLDEEKWTPWKPFFYRAKQHSEKKTLSNSNLMFAITPYEEKTYKKLNPNTPSKTLPLRRLPHFFQYPANYSEKTKNLNIFFFGSTYNVSHNLRAATFVTQDLANALKEKMPGIFQIHIFGAKAPNTLKENAGSNVTFHGFVKEIEDVIAQMDIALMPSFYGCGMQQKIFEPLVRGFPLITHKRAIADYPFEEEKEILYASGTDEFIAQLQRLRDPELRKYIGTTARKKAHDIFSQSQLDDIIQTAIHKLTTNYA